MEAPRVVRIRRTKGEIVIGCDIYIGYPVTAGGWNLSYSKWSSPYALSAFGKERCDPEDNIRLNEAYEAYVRSSTDLMRSLHELSGKTLGCFCPPAPCHGYVLVKLFKEMFGV